MISCNIRYPALQSIRSFLRWISILPLKTNASGPSSGSSRRGSEDEGGSLLAGLFDFLQRHSMNKFTRFDEDSSKFSSYGIGLSPQSFGRFSSKDRH